MLLSEMFTKYTDGGWVAVPMYDQNAAREMERKFSIVAAHCIGRQMGQRDAERGDEMFSRYTHFSSVQGHHGNRHDEPFSTDEGLSLTLWRPFSSTRNMVNQMHMI